MRTLFFAVICITALSGEGWCVRVGTPATITITAEEADDSGGPQGDYFTIDANDDDVRRIQGEPDNKFFDGENEVWYYDGDAVYFDPYGRVVSVKNDSGNLKFR